MSGALAAARPGIGDVNEQRWKAIEALMRMQFDGHDAAALATGRAFYKHLTSLLAPEALLCEWQMADALGVAAFRDQDAFFYLVDNSRSAALASPPLPLAALASPPLPIAVAGPCPFLAQSRVSPPLQSASRSRGYEESG